MTAALMRTATELRVSLTPHETALQRAALGEMVPLSEIPYLDKAQIGPDRFLASLTFHDEAWHTWVHVSDNRFMEIQGWPAEAFYFGRKPEHPADLSLFSFGLHGPQG